MEKEVNMKILTIKETADILKINMHTAYRYAREGTIPTVRLGKSLRVDEEVLERWLTENSGKILGAWKGKKPGKKK